MERLVVYLDEAEAAEIRRLAAMNTRTESAMGRQLIRESMARRWESEAEFRGPPAMVSLLPSSSTGHEFIPQKLNALRCEVCGGKAGEHG